MTASRAWIYAAIGAVTVGAVGLVEMMGTPTIRPGDRILLIGDSLAVGLGTPLGALCSDAGIPFQTLATVGTRIDQWGSPGTYGDALKQALASFQPTLVLISLGTNDAYMQPSPGEDIGQRQAPYLDALLTGIEAAGVRAIVWIAPPTLPAAAISLGPVRTLIAMASRERAPGAFARRISVFPSQRLNLPRGPDNIHPVASGYAGWAGALFQWLT